MSLVTKTDYRHFAGIVLIASVVRGAVLFLSQDSLSADPDAYRRIASCLTKFDTFGLESIEASTRMPWATPTAFRPPLYPWMLSWLTDQDGKVANRSVAFLHWALGVATVIGTYSLTRRLLGERGNTGNGQGGNGQGGNKRRGRMIAFVASGLVAVDPLLLQSTTVVMTETLATALAVLVLWLWVCLVDATRDEGASLFRLALWSLATGTACSAAYLCRPTFILWPLMLCGYLLCQSLVLRRFRPVAAGVMLGCVVCCVVAVWTMRNVSHFGKPIWATTHGGYTLLLGNNPSFFDFVESPKRFGTAWDATFFIGRWDDRGLADPRDVSFWSPQNSFTELADANLANEEEAASGEVADDRLAYETAMATIQRRPSAFVRASWWRIRRLHSPLPLRTGERQGPAVVAVAVFYYLVWALILTGIWKLGRHILSPRWAATVCLWVALASVHTIYWTDMRMRSPLVPVLSILASVGLLMPHGRLSKKSLQGTSQNGPGGSTITTSAS